MPPASTAGHLARCPAAEHDGSVYCAMQYRMGQCGHKLHAAWAHAEYCLPCLSMLWHCPLLLHTLNGSADGCARKSCTFTLQEQYPDLKFPPIPVRGELDLEEVRNSPYFFS